jgi:hypothetical protein
MLALRICLAPALVGIASWASRRWGPAVGGWCAGLPLTSGPVVLILAVERGSEFAAQSAVAVLQALVSLGAFVLAYAWAARRLWWGWSSLAGCAAYLLCTGVLYPVTLPTWLTCVVACTALRVASRAMPADRISAGSLAGPRWDIPLRMLVSAVLVATLTGSAPSLGPRASGLLTPFPVVASILAASTHRIEGPAAAGQLLAGLLAGLHGFAIFFVVIGATIVAWGTTTSFVVATLAALAYQGAAWVRTESSRKVLATRGS